MISERRDGNSVHVFSLLWMIKISPLKEYAKTTRSHDDSRPYYSILFSHNDWQ